MLDMSNRNLLRFADPTPLNLSLLLLRIVRLLILSVPSVLEHLMETIRGNCLAPFVFQEVVLLRRYQIMELSPLQCNPPPSSVLGRLNTGDCRLTKCIPMFTNLTCTKHTSRTLPITWVDSNHSEISFLKMNVHAIYLSPHYLFPPLQNHTFLSLLATAVSHRLRNSGSIVHCFIPLFPQHVLYPFPLPSPRIKKGLVHRAMFDWS